MSEKPYQRSLNSRPAPRLAWAAGVPQSRPHRVPLWACPQTILKTSNKGSPSRAMSVSGPPAGHQRQGTKEDKQVQDLKGRGLPSRWLLFPIPQRAAAPSTTASFVGGGPAGT